MSARNATRVGHGSLTGKLSPRTDSLAGLRGSVTVEQDITVRAGKHLYIAGWMRTDAASGALFVSLVLEQDERGRS